MPVEIYTASAIMEQVARFMFCGFIAFFILPHVFFRLFYFIPRSIYFIRKKRLRKGALLVPLRDVAIWAVIVAALYIIAFLVSPQIGMGLLNGPVAIACWILGIVYLVLTVSTSRRQEWQDLYYKAVYLKYVTAQEKERFDEFTAQIEIFTPLEAKEVLKEFEGRYTETTYLEKQALRARASTPDMLGVVESKDMGTPRPGKNDKS